MFPLNIRMGKEYYLSYYDLDMIVGGRQACLSIFYTPDQRRMAKQRGYTNSNYNSFNLW